MPNAEVTEETNANKMESCSDKYMVHYILKMRLSGPGSHLISSSSVALTDRNLHKFSKSLNLMLWISSLLRSDLQAVFLLFHMVSWDYGAEFRLDLEKNKESAACPDQIWSTVREALLQQYNESGKGS